MMGRWSGERWKRLGLRMKMKKGGIRVAGGGDGGQVGCGTLERPGEWKLWGSECLGTVWEWAVWAEHREGG